MRSLLTLIIFLSLSRICLSQRINSKSAILKLENVNSLNSDGILTFEIGVKMADCLSRVEILDFDKIKKKKNIWDEIHDWWWFKVRKIYDFEVSKKFIKELDEDDYYLRDSDNLSEDIFMKCELLQLKSVFSRKSIKKRLKISVYSKSGRIVYEKVFILNKNKILENGEVRLGVEPS